MRVLHVIPAISTRYGGPSQAIRFLCRHLQSRGDCSVEVATTDADGAGQVLDREEIPDEFPVHVFPRTFSERWKFSRGLGVWLSANVRNYDLVHIHALWSHSSGAAARAARKFDVPFIIRPAGMLSSYTLSRRRGFRKLSWLFSERRTTQFATAFHATTQAEADDIGRVVAGARSFVIPNGVDDLAYSVPVDRTIWRERMLAGEPDRPIVLFLSRLHPKKGLTDLLLPALARFSPRPLTVIAGGVDEHEPQYAGSVQDQVTELRLENDIRLVGNISGISRWNLYDAADVFVLPSHSENFGIVVAEAMARGCPPVVTDGVQLSSEILAHDAGLVVPRQVESLATVLQLLCDNPQRRKVLAANAQSLAREKFSWSGVADQVQSMYRSALPLH